SVAEDALWADTLWIDEPIARLEASPGAAVTVVAWSREAAEVALETGRVRAHVAPRLVGDHFVVRTPLATATAIGTDFSVTHDAARGTTVTVHEGVVLVEAGDGVAATLGAGDALTIGPATAGAEAATDAGAVAVGAAAATAID